MLPAEMPESMIEFAPFAFVRFPLTKAVEVVFPEPPLGVLHVKLGALNALKKSPALHVRSVTDVPLPPPPPLRAEAAEGVIVTVAEPVIAAEDSIHSPVNPAVFTCHVPLAVAEVTAVVEARGITLTVDHVLPPSPVALKLIVPVQVPAMVKVAPPLSSDKPTTRAVVFVSAGQPLPLVVSLLLAAHAGIVPSIDKASSIIVRQRFIDCTS